MARRNQSKKANLRGWDDEYGAQHIRIPWGVIASENFRKLSPMALKVLLALIEQIPSNGNGNLDLANSTMAKHGIRSHNGITRARDELLHYGFIELTRQGGRNSCSLYALMWLPHAKEVSHKFDHSVPVRNAFNPAYKEPRSPYRKRRQQTIQKETVEAINDGVIANWAVQ